MFSILILFAFESCLMEERFKDSDRVIESKDRQAFLGLMAQVISLSIIAHYASHAYKNKQNTECRRESNLIVWVLFGFIIIFFIFSRVVQNVHLIVWVAFGVITVLCVLFQVIKYFT